jgi:Uma2 family endonuclease
MATATGLTIDDFERLPAVLTRNRELVEGELVEVSGNTLQHNILRDYLVALLLPHARQHNLGLIVSEQEFDFDGNAYGPDVCLIGPEKLGLINPKLRVQRFVPDFAIEIVSVHDTLAALLKKAQCYRRSGVREVWILAQENREALVYTERGQSLLNEEAELSSPLLPRFSRKLADLFDQK